MDIYFKLESSNACLLPRAEGCPPTHHHSRASVPLYTCTLNTRYTMKRNEVKPHGQNTSQTIAYNSIRSTQWRGRPGRGRTRGVGSLERQGVSTPQTSPPSQNNYTRPSLDPPHPEFGYSRAFSSVPSRRVEVQHSGTQPRSPPNWSMRPIPALPLPMVQAQGKTSGDKASQIVMNSARAATLLPLPLINTTVNNLHFKKVGPAKICVAISTLVCAYPQSGGTVTRQNIP